MGYKNINVHIIIHRIVSNLFNHWRRQYCYSNILIPLIQCQFQAFKLIQLGGFRIQYDGIPIFQFFDDFRNWSCAYETGYSSSDTLHNTRIGHQQCSSTITCPYNTIDVSFFHICFENF